MAAGANRYLSVPDEERLRGMTNTYRHLAIAAALSIGAAFLPLNASAQTSPAATVTANDTTTTTMRTDDERNEHHHYGWIGLLGLLGLAGLMPKKRVDTYVDRTDDRRDDRRTSV